MRVVGINRLAIRWNLAHGILGRCLLFISSVRICTIFARMRFFTFTGIRTQRARIVLLAAQGLQNTDIAEWLKSSRAGVAGKAPTFQHAFHADLDIVAEHGGAILAGHHGQSAAPGRVHQRARIGHGHRRAHSPSQHPTQPKPFIWTKTTRDILQKAIRANERLSSKQNATLH